MQDLNDGPAMDDRVAELETRIEKMERDRTVTARGRSMMSRVVPPEASTHFRAASREQLMGIRALMDHWIRRLDSHETPKQTEREEIPID
jgi:hypothetical protein